MITPEKRAMTAEKAIAMLKKQNKELSIHEVDAVLNFFYLLAEIYLEEDQDI